MPNPLEPNDLSHLSDEEFMALCPQGFHGTGDFEPDNWRDKIMALVKKHDLGFLHNPGGGQFTNADKGDLLQRLKPKAKQPTSEEFLKVFNENDWNYISPETFEDIARTVLQEWG